MSFFRILKSLVLILIFIYCNDSQQVSDQNELSEDYLNELSKHDNITKDLKELFKNIDLNNDSAINNEELFSKFVLSLNHLHNDLTNEEFMAVDSDKDQQVSLEEYFIYEYKAPSVVMEKYSSAKIMGVTKLRKKIQNEKDRFVASDNNEDGFLSVYEYIFFKYTTFFPHMAYTIIPTIIDDIDKDKDGLLDLQEYIDSFKIVDSKDEKAKEKSLKKAEKQFKVYDKDNNGKIDVAEYHDVLKPGYAKPANSQTEYLFEENDSNNDGILTFEEIVKHPISWLDSILVYPAKKTFRHLGDEL